MQFFTFLTLKNVFHIKFCFEKFFWKNKIQNAPFQNVETEHFNTNKTLG